MPDILEQFTAAPEVPGHGVKVHTTSSLNCYMKCPRLYQYRYEMKYRSATDIPALLIGSAVHVGLEWFWKGVSYHEAMVKVCEFMAEEQYFKGDGKVDAARVAAYVRGYYQRWGKSRDEYDVIGVELQFFIDGMLDDKQR